MDYLCAKFGDFGFSRFGIIVPTDRRAESQTHTQTERQTESQRRVDAILTRLPSASVIKLSFFIIQQRRAHTDVLFTGQ